MLDTLTRYLVGVPEMASRYALRFILLPLCDRSSSQPLTNAGLVISGAGLTVAKTGAAPFYAAAVGDLVMIPAGTVLPALTGIAVPAGNFNVACFFTDNGGNLTVAGGTAGPTLQSVVWPQFPLGRALIGFLIIPGPFVGGTTALDAVATVYVSPVGGFDPTVTV